MRIVIGRERHPVPLQAVARCWAAAVLSLLAVVVVAPLAVAAPAGARIALVVGNSDYKAVERLANPGNDARLVAHTLRAEGFTLIGGDAQLDLDKQKFDNAVREFGRAVAGAEVALFYYSGHGMQVDGVNYLVPVDANPSRPQDLDFQMVNAELVLRQMTGSGTRLNIMILDACRNNPFGGRGLRAAGGGLAEMKAPDGTLISYATQPGSVARDGAGRDSPYTLALVDAMHQPGLDVFRMFNKVGLTVKKDTGGQQEPWLAASPIEGEFAFAPGAGQTAAAATAVPAAAPAPAPAPAPKPAEQTAALAPPLNPATPLRQGTTAAPAAIVLPPLAPAPGPAPTPEGAGFRCPGKDTIVTGENQVFAWNGGAVAVLRATAAWAWRSLGPDPTDPASCLRAGPRGTVHRIADWFNTDVIEFSDEPRRPMLALLQGQADGMELRFVARHYSGNAVQPVFTTRWKRHGHETLAIAGRSYDTLTFDIAESSSRNSYVGGGRMWYAPALHLFVRRIWRTYNSDDVLGWTVTGITQGDGSRGAPISASEPP